jgi:hypothetical protein
MLQHPNACDIFRHFIVNFNIWHFHIGTKAEPPVVKAMLLHAEVMLLALKVMLLSTKSNASATC